MQHSLPQGKVQAVTPYSSVSADSGCHYCSDGASVHDDVDVPMKGRQSSLLTEHDSDRQRSVHGPVEN